MLSVDLFKYSIAVDLLLVRLPATSKWKVVPTWKMKFLLKTFTKGDFDFFMKWKKKISLKIQ